MNYYDVCLKQKNTDVSIPIEKDVNKSFTIFDLIYQLILKTIQTIQPIIHCRKANRLKLMLKRWAILFTHPDNPPVLNINCKFLDCFFQFKI